MQSPYAQPAPRVSGVSYAPAPFQPGAMPMDDNDRVILQEAGQAQLAIDDVLEDARAGDGQFGRAAWTVLSGTHTAERMRTYRVRAADGLSWTYVQPYSTFRQMPGEHTFILQGSLPQPVQVLPAHNNWRRPRFIISLCSMTFVLLFLFGAGLLLPPLLMLIFPIRARFQSPDANLAKWLKGQPAIQNSVRSTKWGWLGFLGSGGWRLQWAIQLFSMGDGTSRLVIKSPDVGRVDLARYRVGFAQAAFLARAFQSVMSQGTFTPPQRPMQMPLQ